MLWDVFNDNTGKYLLTKVPQDEAETFILGSPDRDCLVMEDASGATQRGWNANRTPPGWDSI